jgi:hypothetical protein
MDIAPERMADLLRRWVWSGQMAALLIPEPRASSMMEPINETFWRWVSTGRAMAGEDMQPLAVIFTEVTGSLIG